MKWLSNVAPSWANCVPASSLSLTHYLTGDEGGSRQGPFMTEICSFKFFIYSFIYLFTGGGEGTNESPWF